MWSKKTESFNLSISQYFVCWEGGEFLYKVFETMYLSCLFRRKKIVGIYRNAKVGYSTLET